jgi:hypothetical protein
LSKHLKGEPTNVARDVAAALLALVRQMGVCLGKAEEAYATLDDSRFDLVSEGAYGEILLQLPALQEAGLASSVPSSETTRSRCKGCALC